MSLYLLRVFLFAVFLLSVQNAVGQTLYVYVQAPGTASSGQTEDLTGIIGTDVETSTFDTNTVQTYTTSFSTSIGTFNTGALPGTTGARIAVVAANQFGGAGGTGNYLALGAQSGSATPVTVTLNSPSNYIGLWWSAADTNNSIELFNSGTLVGTIQESEFTSRLPDTTGTTVTAINGTSVYNTTAYYGNPNTNFSGQDGGEPFIYTDDVLVGGTFNEIEILNNGTTGTGFESDNWTIYTGTVTLANIPTTDVGVVPEPSQYALTSGAFIFCLIAGQRLLKRLRRGLTEGGDGDDAAERLNT
jgi:hypothetical protein